MHRLRDHSRIKTDYRNSLNEKTLDNLMRISIDGPPAEEYNTRQAVERFFAAKPRRPNTLPYNASKSGHGDEATGAAAVPGTSSPSPSKRLRLSVCATPPLIADDDSYSQPE